MGQKLGTIIQQENLNRSKSNLALSQSFGHQHQPSSIVYTFSQQESTIGKPSASLNHSIGHQNSNTFSQNVAHHQNSNVGQQQNSNVSMSHNTNYIYNLKQTENVASGRNRGNGIIPQPQTIRQQQQIAGYGQKDIHPISKWDSLDDDEDFADILG